MGFVFRINFETLATQAIRLQPTGGLAQAGGVARPTLECRTAPSALVQTAVNPPPAPSRWDVARKRGECVGRQRNRKLK